MFTLAIHKFTFLSLSFYFLFKLFQNIQNNKFDLQLLYSFLILIPLFLSLARSLSLFCRTLAFYFFSSCSPFLAHLQCDLCF